MKHPSGAVGTFVFRPIEHGRNGLPHSVCHSASQYTPGVASPSRMSVNFALFEKTLSGPVNGRRHHDCTVRRVSR
jgi:hypothetical protein